MQFSITALLFGLVAVSSAAIADVENVRNTPRSVLENRQAANGACCIPEQSLKQDACTVNGAAGKCVPGGPAACTYIRDPNTLRPRRVLFRERVYERERHILTQTTGNGALNCVANDQLVCDNNVQERSGNLCRFQAANGKIQDGAQQINSLAQAKVN